MLLVVVVLAVVELRCLRLFAFSAEVTRLTRATLCAKNALFLSDLYFDSVNLLSTYRALGGAFFHIALVSFIASCLLELAKIMLKVRQARGDLPSILMYLPVFNVIAPVLATDSEILQYKHDIRKWAVGQTFTEDVPTLGLGILAAWMGDSAAQPADGGFPPPPPAENGGGPREADGDAGLLVLQPGGGSTRAAAAALFPLRRNPAQLPSVLQRRLQQQQASPVAGAGGCLLPTAVAGAGSPSGGSGGRREAPAPNRRPQPPSPQWAHPVARPRVASAAPSPSAPQHPYASTLAHRRVTPPAATAP
eukprot:gene31647-43113_t